MQNNFLQAALDYAGRGYSVIPVRGDKKPFISWTEHQKRRATAEDIQEWAAKYPGASVGIVTGEISGILVIDCDTREGYEAIQKLLPDALLLPIARTPRGGWHLWFLYPVGSKITVGIGIIPGVDYRGEGGYIIAPPSVNGDGKGYTWQEGLSLEDVEPAPLPASLYNIFSLYIEGCGQHRPQETTKTTEDHNFFHQGRRDNDLFHAANCLIKGGCELTFAEHVIDILARYSDPPFPESEIRAKIDSALKRAESRERNLAAEIRDWIMTTEGNFMTTDVHRELQLTTRDHMKAAVMALSRLCDGPNPLIEKYGNKRGCYRRIETDIEPVNFLTAPTGEFPITWPMDIDDHCIIYPGNIVIVAGSKSAGKTSFLLNVVKKNMHQHEIVYLNSEMGDTEFRKRLELFEDVPLSSWNFRAYHRASTFSDLITPEKKIFIVDFLEVTTDFWKVAQYIQEIHKKLKAGICIIALQKSEGRDAGRGGDFSKEKARLYLSLDYLHDEKMNRIKITDAKAWRTDRNPRGMYRTYKLVRGSRFIPVTDWRD
ncbi:MAG: hypothetical protein A2V65_01595 [Deltaproteobacteria bacterium RBG_13_49_15]|nr:MAG: hypothetical protein A2V65_01595 [Deltaproteobacteria bacterium RBG_13_49_15]